MSASGSLPRSQASSHSQNAETSELQLDANDNNRAELRSCDVHTESIPQSADANSSTVLSGRQQRYLEREERRQLADILQQQLSDNEGSERPASEGQQNSQEVGNVPNRSDNQEPTCSQNQQNCHAQESQDPASDQNQNNPQSLESNQEQENGLTCSNDQEQNDEHIREHCQLPVNVQIIAGEQEQATNQQNNMEGIPLRPSDEGISRRRRRTRHARRERYVSTIDQRLNIERIRCRATRICQSLFEITGASQSLQNEILQFRQLLVNQAFRRDHVNRNVQQQGYLHPEQNSNPNEGNPNSDG